MVELITYAAAISAVCTLISESRLLAPVREWLGFPLFYCPICLSYWVGSPLIYTHGPIFYLAAVCLSALGILVTLRVYAELDSGV